MHRILAILSLVFVCVHAQAQTTLSHDQLRDRIRGGWAGQAIGVTFGGPTEFRYNGTFIPDYKPIPWSADRFTWWYRNAPGLYDDIYMDLTFVDVFEKLGLDAPADSFAVAFARAGYMLWHANQSARYNILAGMKPPATGHWLNNPDADDIDFQIESDFAGLMSPGLPQAAAAYCDRIGHIMNYGDGYYGGVYMATMYSLAFVSDDVAHVVREGLKAIPEQSTFHKTISDVIRWHSAYPDDWKRTWFELERKWGQDIGCPHGVFVPFNIDARMNAAYVVLGLLYGNGDFGRTVSIATRAGQDSDCNPASAAGILGTIKGYDAIPEYWKQGLADVEPVDFQHTTISLDEAYDLSYRHALQVVRRNGGAVSEAGIRLPAQAVLPVPFEESFTGHSPVAEVGLDRQLFDTTSFAFDGIGFAVQGDAESGSGAPHVLEVEVVIDGKSHHTTMLPTDFTTRKHIPFFAYDLPRGRHQVKLRVLRPAPNVFVRLQRAVIYDSEPSSFAP